MINILNNIHTYNNSNYGIYIFNNANNTIINNVSSYNNKYGIYISASTLTKYYGNLKLFANASGNVYTGGGATSQLYL